MTLPIQQWIDEAKQTNIKLAKQRCLEFNDEHNTNKTWQEGYAMIVEKFKDRPHWLAWCDLEVVIDVLKDEYSVSARDNSDTQK